VKQRQILEKRTSRGSVGPTRQWDRVNTWILRHLLTLLTWILCVKARLLSPSLSCERRQRASLGFEFMRFFAFQGANRSCEDPLPKMSWNAW